MFTPRLLSARMPTEPATVVPGPVKLKLIAKIGAALFTPVLESSIFIPIFAPLLVKVA